MPRRYDYDMGDIAAVEYDNKKLAIRKAGKLEISMQEYFGPSGIMAWLFGNFQAHIYDTGKMDAIFDWIDENAQHSWYWLEMSTNHGHSVVTTVYFSDETDAVLFRLR